MSRFISVVIPTYNSAAFVVSAVESVLRQELEPAEIIVVDDGSTDDTADALGPYRRSIRYITQPNSGPAVARNRGVGAVQSDWIAFLDADDVWMPHKLRRQVECMKQNPRAGLIHSAFLDWDNRTGETSHSHLRAATQLQRSLLSRVLFPERSLALDDPGTKGMRRKDRRFRRIDPQAPASRIMTSPSESPGITSLSTLTSRSFCIVATNTTQRSDLCTWSKGKCASS